MVGSSLKKRKLTGRVVGTGMDGGLPDTYDVAIKLNVAKNGFLESSCSCPYCNGIERYRVKKGAKICLVCKHVVAVLYVRCS